MSLDDMYNRWDDSNFIDRVDKAVFEFHLAVSSRWERWTHRDKRDLETMLYGGSFILLATNAIVAEHAVEKILSAGIALYSAFYGVYNNFRPKGNVHDDVQLESLGIPAGLLRWIYPIGYCMTAAATVLSTAGLLLGIMADEPKIAESSLNFLIYTAGLNASMSAGYISRGNN